MNNESAQERNRGFYLLPNLFTISALFAGFYAIVAAMGHEYQSSGIAIFISMIFDGLDGKVARLTNTQTAFGAEFDSLSDMVSFGISPALAVYSWGLHSLYKFGWLVAFIYVVSAALRLARFNTQLQKQSKNYFVGLPSPAGAAVLAGILWIGGKYELANTTLIIVVAAVTLILGLLMISNIVYRNLKDVDLTGKVPFMVIIGFIFLLAFISLSPAEILLSLFSLYTLSGPALAAYRYKNRRKNKSQ